MKVRSTVPHFRNASCSFSSVISGCSFLRKRRVCSGRETRKDLLSSRTIRIALREPLGVRPSSRVFKDSVRLGIAIDCFRRQLLERGALVAALPLPAALFAALAAPFASWTHSLELECHLECFHDLAALLLHESRLLPEWAGQG